MNSFDFFDTLATRRVARPLLVFELVERLLPWPGFAALRTKAEAAARKQHAPREVTLDDIYARLPDDPRRAAARDEELRLERALLVPIPGNLRRIQPGDIVVSDFYLGADHLREALRGFGVKPLPVVHVSSEAGCHKHDGRLWDRLLAEGHKPQWHIGDNPQGDVAQPQKRGIKVYPFRGADLSRWEQAWAGHGLLGGAVAGCARAARLAHHRVDEPPEETALCDIFGAAVAPALLAFVDHVLDSCMKRGIGRALFLARDGQLLHRLAEQRVRARRLKLEVLYAHGSRLALHLPGFTAIESAESWLLEDTPGLNLAELAARAGLSPAELLPIAREQGLDLPAEQVLAPAQRARLPALIRSPAFVKKLGDVSARVWPAAFAYYSGLGLAGSAPIALVDVGWSGRMQSSLRGLMEKGGSGAPVHGFYFCLSRKLRHPGAGGAKDTLEGFAFDPERDRGENRLDGQRAMVETLLEADEGSTLAFEQRKKGKAWPVLGAAPSAAELRWVRLQQGAVLAFAHEWAQFEAATKHSLPVERDAAVKVLEQLLYRPRREDAQAFAGRSREAGAGAAAQPLVTQLAAGVRLAERESWGLWPEGSLALFGAAPLSPLLRLVRRLRK